jgi:homoserine kinase type II
MELNRADVEKLIEPYSLGKLIGFSKIAEQGFMNYMYIVTTDSGKYILRIGKKTKKEKDLLFEIELVNGLSGLPVPQYVADNAGQYVNEVDGHNYTIYHYLEGKMPDVITDSLFRQIAEFLAEFHKQTKGFDVSQERFAWYTFSDSRADEFEGFLLEKLGEHGEDIRYLKKELLENRLPDTLPAGPIHVDVRRHNVLAVGEKLTGVVDFDNCQIGPYVLDIGMTILWLCTTEDGLDYGKAAEFVKAYEKVRRLGDDERKYLFQAVKYAYLCQEFVDWYVYAKGYVDEEHWEEGRRLFLRAVKRLDEGEFGKYFLPN